jgi:hypothetical protein
MEGRFSQWQHCSSESNGIGAVFSHGRLYSTRAEDDVVSEAENTTLAMVSKYSKNDSQHGNCSRMLYDENGKVSARIRR